MGLVPRSGVDVQTALDLAEDGRNWAVVELLRSYGASSADGGLAARHSAGGQSLQPYGSGSGPRPRSKSRGR